MKKMSSMSIKKSIISLLLAFSTIGSTTAFADEAVVENTAINYEFTASVQEIVNRFVNEYPYMQEEIFETVEIVTGMPTYISAFEYDENVAYELLCSSLKNLVSHSGVSTYGADYKGKFYSNYTVPTVKQSTAYNCGIAAALQAVIGDGYLSNTTANKSKSKMTEIAGYVGYDESGKKRSTGMAGS